MVVKTGQAMEEMQVKMDSLLDVQIHKILLNGHSELNLVMYTMLTQEKMRRLE